MIAPAVIAHACTIIARNYLPFARVLGRSFLANHPGGRFTVLVIDDFRKEVDESAEAFDVLRLDDLPEDPASLHRMALYYDVIELATAVKPWLFQRLFEDGASEVMYIDPDIRVYEPLDDIVSLASAKGIVLTPHVIAPMPRDGRMVDERSILASGIYNLGFIALNRSTHAFLEFWKERLRFECIAAPERMRFVDQRWVDFVPGMFDVAILRDPACNVSYWNLDHRPLRWSGSRYEIRGEPLRFFHFSGYRPDVPHVLSRHQGDRPRILLSEYADLLRLTQEYGSELFEFGFDSDEAASTERSTLANGLPVDETVRMYFRDWLSSARIGEQPLPPDPFDVDGAEEILARLNETAGADSGPSRLSRYLATRYALEADLRARFPDPQDADFNRFREWARVESEAGRLDPRLVPRARSERSAPAPATTRRGSARLAKPRPGVRVSGYLRAEMGVGQLGRLAALSVEAAGIPISHDVNPDTTSRQSHRFVPKEGDDLNVNLVCVNADELPRFAHRVGDQFFQSHYTIGYWAWEVPLFPTSFAGAFDFVDEIWGCSSFTAQAISLATSKPVFAFPPPVVAPEMVSPLDRGALGIPSGPLFLFCFDMLSVMERKNPIGLVDAFTQAFEPGTGPTLVIKVMNGDRNVSELERLRVRASARPDVVVIDRYLDHAQISALMAACDCYASLHRSEGFGLTMAEAMALGKPVVATGFSGNMDFMSDRTAYLVPWSETQVPRGCDPYPPGSTWAQPDIGAAASLLRYVAEHPAEAAEVGGRAREAVSSDHSASARAAFVQSRFEDAQRVLRRRRRNQRLRKVLPAPIASLGRRARRAPQPAPRPEPWRPVEAEVEPSRQPDVRSAWPEAVLDRLNKPSRLGRTGSVMGEGE